MKDAAKSRATSGPFSVEQIREARLRIDAVAIGDAVTYAELRAVEDKMGFMLPDTD